MKSKKEDISRNPAPVGLNWVSFIFKLLKATNFVYFEKALFSGGACNIKNLVMKKLSCLTVKQVFTVLLISLPGLIITAQQNTSYSDNTNNIGGEFSTAFGYQSLSNSTGSYNTANGF